MVAGIEAAYLIDFMKVINSATIFCVISFCTTEAFDDNVAVEVGWETMTTWWPDVEYQETDSNYDEFWTHEWDKHGTCSGLSQYDYFNYATQLIQSFGTPATYTAAATSTGTMSAADLRNDFGGATMASLQCTSGKYINGVFTCWSSVNGVPTTQVVCPADVQVLEYQHDLMLPCSCCPFHALIPSR